ncbi:putative nucleotidyltransferase, ribonuclease H [Tanacetum coccineum]
MNSRSWHIVYVGGTLRMQTKDVFENHESFESLVQRSKVFLAFDLGRSFLSFGGCYVDDTKTFGCYENFFFAKNDCFEKKKCFSDETLVIPLEDIQIDDKLHFIEEPMEIIDQEVKRLKQSHILIVKALNDERILEGPEMIEVTNEKVAVAREKLKEAQTRQKSYADRHRRALEFQPGEHVFLKVSPTRGVRRFGIKGKLSPRFIGPFEILDRVGEVSYRLALPPQLSHVHNVFHVSLLRGYKYHPLHVVSYPFDQIREDLSYTEEPESILDRQDRVMRNKTIPFVKILWRNHPEREATWETEESIRTSYPHFLP